MIFSFVAPVSWGVLIVDLSALLSSQTCGISVCFCSSHHFWIFDCFGVAWSEVAMIILSLAFESEFTDITIPTPPTPVPKNKNQEPRKKNKKWSVQLQVL